MIDFVPMTEEDVDAVWALDRLCFRVPWSRKSFADEMDNPMAVYFLAKEEEKIVGYAGYWLVAGEGHITNIAVHPDYRRRQIGTGLLVHIIASARKNNLCLLTLEVRESNTAAQALYEAHGFKKIGMRKHYYSDNRESAYIMTRIF
jgi:ribosomal-protein-alanine N-acetyltransferase